MKPKSAVLLLRIIVLGILGCASFGRSIKGARLERVQQSPQYEDADFFNVERQSPMNLTWGYLKEQFFGDQLRVPRSAIPVIEIKPEALSRPAPGMRTTWIGHAGVLILPADNGHLPKRVILPQTLLG